MSSRSYCFTSFAKEITPIEGGIRYMICGKETCPKTGKEHWQGYVEFPKKVTLKQAQQIIGDPVAHLEKRHGDRESARDYCKKDGKYTEIGDWKAGGQGARTDLHNIVKKIESGATDADLLRENPETIFRYHKFIQNARRILEEEKSQEYIKGFGKSFIPNPYQTKILNKLQEQTEREVLWVTDIRGGRGKTWLSKYLVSIGAERFTNGKTADIAYAIKGKDVVIFDFSRSLAEHVNYDVIEQIKNGLIFSGKYESRCKMFKPPKVLILANFKPDYSKLSEDRWTEIED